MKIRIMTVFVIVSIIIMYQGCSTRQGNEPWKQNQLMKPADLAKILNDPNTLQPIIYCVGPQAIIKNSIYIGPAYEKDNLNKLKVELDKLSRNADIVIYCGCCPLNVCPNVRPAFNLLNEMGFKNQKLLDLEHNIKVDWIDHGYPVSN